MECLTPEPYNIDYNILPSIYLNPIFNLSYGLSTITTNNQYVYFIV